MTEPKNTTGRSVHQSIRALEDAVAYFLADAKERATPQAFGGFGLRDMGPPLKKLEAALAAHHGEAPEVPRKEYERKVGKTHREDEDEVEETHESYGLVEVSRVSGGARLFGSSVHHQHFFRLRVLRAKRVARQYGEHFWTDGRVPIVEIELSPAQFVEMITSQNIGSGTPCTIHAVEGVTMDAVPDSAGSELKLMAEIFEHRLAEVVAKTTSEEAALGELLDKKSLNKDDKARILGIATRVRRLLDDSAPFVLKTFGESTEKMVAKGKMEVDAFIQLALRHAGIKSIRDSGGELRLGSGSDDAEEP